MKPYDFARLFSVFKVEGELLKADPVGIGHIHETFILKNKNSDAGAYLLQRINHNVFKNVPLLMQNIETVTAHINNKVNNNRANAGLSALYIIRAKDGQLYHKDHQGNYWRMFNFINDAISYEVLKTTGQAYNSGLAFGRFLALLQDLSPASVSETIPDFHDVEKRYEIFKQTIERDPAGRVKKYQEEIGFINSRIDEMSYLNKLAREGKVPVRITHNDTKINNVLFNSNDKFLCVIDLDTVMPGLVAYDFGDAIRTGANTANEDENDISKINLNLKIFESFAKGFLEETKPFLTQQEKESLPFGAKLLTFIMGLRFFTDFLDGDRYYKINFPEHNLHRARAQFQLLRKMENDYDAMKQIVQKYC